MSSSIEVPMSRPGFGKAAFKKSTVACNVFRVEILNAFPKQFVFQYSVHITDSKDWSPPVVLRKRVFKKIFENLNGRSPPIYPVFDGDKLAFSHEDIPKDLLTGEVNATKPNEKDNIFKYTLTPIKGDVIKGSELATLLLGAQHPKFTMRSDEDKLSALNKAKQLFQALNIAIKYPISIDENRSFSTNRAVFPFRGGENCEKRISGGVLLKRGYMANLRVGTNTSGQGAPNNLLLSIDSTCAAFIDVEPGCLVNVASNILKCDPRQLFDLRDDKKRNLLRVLRKLRIRIKRNPNDPGIIRAIYGFGSSSATERFQTEEGEETVQGFFQKHHGVELRGPHFPTVQTSSKKTVLYPMELCEVLPYQQYKLKLQADQQQDALVFQTSRPEDRFSDIRNGYYGMMSQEARDLAAAYGLAFSRDWLDVPCRVLEPTHLIYGERGSARAERGQWNIARPPRKLLQPGELRSWAVMTLTQRNLNEGEVMNFFRAFSDKLNQLGINWTKGKIPIVRCQGTSLSDIRSALLDTGKQAFQAFGSGPQIIICVTEEKSQYYSMIKTESDQLADKGVTTQCMITKHLRNAQDQYLTNLALKLNIKIGGTNHAVPALGRITQGVDLSHQNLGSGLKPSVVGMVGTMDQNLCRYSGVVGVQPLLEPANERSRPRSQEPIEKFEDMLYQLLVRWKESFPVPQFPKKIIIFRDGVSEGEFGQVLLREFVGAKTALKRIGDTNNVCKVTFIVCAKSHRIRFLASPAEQDKSGNAPAGLIVDQELGDPHLFDFFCQSQGGLKGTSRPCRYCVLKDENCFSPDDLQELINSVCSSYQPATRSVGMAAPAYYADILADRGRMWLNVDDDHASSLAGTSQGEQTEEHRFADLEAFNDKVDNMMKKIDKVNHTMWWT
ncbi:ribonuclease H-like domain-containing protein [Melampsora americana]|nr:ribonuclease H-like domain-containing protein [Melampsora americana]